MSAKRAERGTQRSGGEKAWHPRVTVACIAERDGRYLMVEEYDSKGRLMLNQPAGHWEYGETLAEAAARETLEETGYLLTPKWIIGTFIWDKPGSRKTFVRTAFAGELRDGDPNAVLDDGIVRPLWMTPAEIAAESARLRSPMVLQSIEAWEAGVRLPLSAIAHL